MPPTSSLAFKLRKPRSRKEPWWLLLCQGRKGQNHRKIHEVDARPEKSSSSTETCFWLERQVHWEEGIRNKIRPWGNTKS